MRNPSTPRSNQNRRVVLELGLDLGVVPVEVGLLGREQVEVPLAGEPSGSVTRVQAGPPNTLCQSFGGTRRRRRGPGRKM